MNLRRSARSDHETELVARSPSGADANSSFFGKQSSRKKSYYEKTGPRPGVWFSGASATERRHIGGRARQRHTPKEGGKTTTKTPLLIPTHPRPRNGANSARTKATTRPPTSSSLEHANAATVRGTLLVAASATQQLRERFASVSAEAVPACSDTLRHGCGARCIVERRARRDASSCARTSRRATRRCELEGGQTRAGADGSGCDDELRHEVGGVSRVIRFDEGHDQGL